MKYYMALTGVEVLAAEVTELTPGSGLLVHSASRTVSAASITSRGGGSREGITPEGLALSGLGPNMASFVTGDTVAVGSLTQTVKDGLVVALADDVPFDADNPPSPFAGTRDLQGQAFNRAMLGVQA